MPRVLVAVAWPYANGPFHIGHLAGAYLPGDTFARYHRLRGNEVLFVSGSDMHGTPTLVRAEAEGIGPEAVANRYHAINRSSFERLGFTFDTYTTTHTANHEHTVDEVFLLLLERGYIHRRTEESPYCPKHQRFLPDRYLVGTCPNCGLEEARGDECDRCGRPMDAKTLGSPRCSLCGTPAEFRPSEHFYLGLDQLQPKLAEYLHQQTHWRPGTLRVAQNFLDEGLHATPITRDLEWGVPIPLDGYGSKRFYVWFEAVIGYLSASREWAIRAGRPEAWHQFWDAREPVRQYYFVGKDNKFFHTIIWPAILLGLGTYVLPYDVPANEWLLIAGKKISKSRPADLDVFIPSLLSRYAPDLIRFYAALLAPQNHDTEFDWDEFHRVSEEILSNQYGNLVQRALVLVRDRCGGKIPEGRTGIGPHLRAVHERITERFERVQLKEALDLALGEVREANRRFHEARPWAASGAALLQALNDALASIRAIATWLSPVLPFSSVEVHRMLGFPSGPEPGEWDRALEPLITGQPLGEVRPLFPRATRTVGPNPTSAPSGGGVPSLVIRAGTIRSVAPHPDADRLYVLGVDLGEETPRTIVAGMRAHYAPEQLEGRRVTVLANLAPRTIRRITSQGMVLAAEAGETVTLLAPPEGVPSGAIIDGAAPDAPIITIEELAKTPLVVGRVEGPEPGAMSRVDIGGRRVAVEGTWPTGSMVIVRLAAPGSDRGMVLHFRPGGPIRPTAELPAGSGVR